MWTAERVAIAKERSMYARRHGARPHYAGVYFVGWGAYIKVGYAGDIVARLKTIELAIPEGAVTPFAWIPQDLTAGRPAVDVETRVHQTLISFRARGEWFTDCAGVRQFIERHGSPWPT